MMAEYDSIVTSDGYEAQSFKITTRRGSALGLYTKDRIWVHCIIGDGSIKGIMQILIHKFKTNQVTFTPLINDNVKKSIRGEIKVCKADALDNPYKEDFEYMDCVWDSDEVEKCQK